MRKIFLIVLFLAACQSGRGNYNNSLQQWLGQTESSLQQSWGIPQDVYYITPDAKVLTYVRVSNTPTDGNSPYSSEIYYSAIDTQNWGVPAPAENGPYYCKTLFTVTNGIVTDYSFNGDNCVAKN